MIDPTALLAATGDVAIEVASGGMVIGLSPAGASQSLPGLAIGSSIAEALPPELAEVAVGIVATTSRERVARSFDFWLQTPEGRRHLEARVGPGGNGSALVVVRDLQEAGPSEPRVEAGEAWFRVMADHAPVLLWMAGLDAECSFFNQQWLAFTGRPLERELGVGWAEGVHFEDLQACMTTFLTSFAARTSFRMEYRLRRADGVYRWILDTGIPRYAPDGTFLGFVGSCIDISDLREAREVLARSNVELEQRVRDRTRDLEGRIREREVLVREVHHRVKNNLQLVSSLLNFQGQRFDDEQLRQLMSECQLRIQSIALIHERLYQAANLAEVQFAQYVRAVAVNVFRSGLDAAQISLVFDLEDVALEVDVAIPCGLILNELLTNAIKHAFPNHRAGVVHVGLHRVGPERLSLTVSDDGVGLPAALDLNQTETMGMQLVLTLTSQIHGELDVKREPGATFRLDFRS